MVVAGPVFHLSVQGKMCVVVSEAGDVEASVWALPKLIEGYSVLYTFLIEIGQHT